MFKLDGKSAVVTGAGSGIGRSIAEVFAAQGAYVHVLDINDSVAQETVQTIANAGGEAEAHRCDVTKQQEVRDVLDPLLIDYVKQNIRCNCVCPTRIHTPFVDEFIKKNYPGEEEAVFKKLSDYQPMGRMGRPEEVAHLALYLCSDEAEFITGQDYPIDGGVMLVY